MTALASGSQILAHPRSARRTSSSTTCSIVLASTYDYSKYFEPTGPTCDGLKCCQIPLLTKRMLQPPGTRKDTDRVTQKTKALITNIESSSSSLPMNILMNTMRDDNSPSFANPILRSPVKAIRAVCMNARQATTTALSVVFDYTKKRIYAGHVLSPSVGERKLNLCPAIRFYTRVPVWIR